MFINHYFRKDQSPQDTKVDLDKHYCGLFILFKTVYKWLQDFESGYMSISDVSSERPVELTTPEIINIIHDLVMLDKKNEGA